MRILISSSARSVWGAPPLETRSSTLSFDGVLCLGHADSAADGDGEWAKTHPSSAKKKKDDTHRVKRIIDIPLMEKVLIVTQQHM